MISDSARILPNVELGKNVSIGENCLIGVTNPHCEGKTTVIGDNSVIRSHSVIYAGNVIGENFHCGHAANIRENNKIGNNVSLGTHSVIEHQVTIEDDVRIHTQVFIPEHSVLQKGCWIGPNVVLTNAKFPNQPDTKANLAGPIVGKKARVGANATLLPGVKVGLNAFVGAGSVVTKDVPDETTVAGNPAKILENK